jgi:hypothetical protein
VLLFFQLLGFAFGEFAATYSLADSALLIMLALVNGRFLLNGALAVGVPVVAGVEPPELSWASMAAESSNVEPITINFLFIIAFIPSDSVIQFQDCF